VKELGMKEQSTTRGFAVLSAAGILVKILSLLYIPFLRRIITDQGHGIYAAAYTIFVFVYVLTNSGIPIAISKLISELIAVENYRDAIKTFKIARFMLLVLGMGMSIFMIIFAGPLVRMINNEGAYLSIVALSPSIFITSVMSAYRGYFQGRGNMTPTAVSQVSEQVINIIFSLVFAALLIRYGYETGAAGGTVGTTLGALVACIYLMITYERNKKFRVARKLEHEVERLPNKLLFKRLVSYAIPMTLSIGLQNAGNLVDLANIMNRLEVAGFGEPMRRVKWAILSQFNTLSFVPIALISALSAAVLPAIAGAAAANNRKLVQDKISYALRICFIVAIPSAVGLAVLSRPIFALLFNPEGYKLMMYGSVVVVLMSVVQIQTTILQSVGKLYAVTVALVLGIIGKIITNYVLVANPDINILGAVFGNIVAFTIPLAINNRVIYKSMKLRLGLVKHAVKPAVASAFMGLVVYITYFNFETLLPGEKVGRLLATVPTFVSIFVGMGVYSYGLILSGGITKKDLDSMSPRLLKLIPGFMKSRIR
jgi:stage V sporulation protein B